MADAVTIRKDYESDRFLVFTLTGVSDGTGESAVTKVDPAAYNMSIPGQIVQFFSVENIKATVQGFTKVTLLWDADTDTTLDILGTGMTNRNYEEFDGKVDPKGTGWTGKILLTTANTPVGGTYEIKLKLKKKRTSF